MYHFSPETLRMNSLFIVLLVLLVVAIRAIYVFQKAKKMELARKFTFDNLVRTNKMVTGDLVPSRVRFVKVLRVKSAADQDSGNPYGYVRLWASDESETPIGKPFWLTLSLRGAMRIKKYIDRGEFFQPHEFSFELEKMTDVEIFDLALVQEFAYVKGIFGESPEVKIGRYNFKSPPGIEPVSMPLGSSGHYAELSRMSCEVSQ